MIETILTLTFGFCAGVLVALLWENQKDLKEIQEVKNVRAFKLSKKHF